MRSQISPLSQDSIYRDHSMLLSANRSELTSEYSRIYDSDTNGLVEFKGQIKLIYSK